MWLAQSLKCYHAGFPLIKPGYIVISLGSMWLRRHTTELTEWILFVKRLKVQLLLDTRSSLLSHSYFMFLSTHILSDELDDLCGDKSIPVSAGAVNLSLPSPLSLALYWTCHWSWVMEHVSEHMFVLSLSSCVSLMLLQTPSCYL